MENELLDHYRERARAECEAALNASCAEARRAHAEMAAAYDRLVEIAEHEQRSVIEAGQGS